MRFLIGWVVRPASCQAMSAKVSTIFAITKGGGGYFDIVGDREKNATPVEGSKLLPIDPCRQYVEVNSSRAIPLAETIDRHMDACGWAVGTIAVVPLGGDCGAIESSEILEKVVVNYVIL